MKNIRTLATKFMVGALALAVTSLATRIAKAEDVAQVITIYKIEGAARFSTDNKTWQTLRKGDVLRPGTVIQTAEKSSIDLLLGDPVAIHGASRVFADVPTPATPGLGAGAGLAALNDNGLKDSILHVFPSTVVSIDKLVSQRTGVDEVSDTQIDLRSGRILGDVKKLSAASRYEIKIPIGVAGIRGTTYTVSANGTVYCLTGSVTISYLSATNTMITVTVPAGMSFNPYQAPGTGAPVPVAGAGYEAPIPAPVLAALTAAYSGPPVSPPSNYTKNGSTIYISPN